MVRIGQLYLKGMGDKFREKGQLAKMKFQLLVVKKGVNNA